MSNLNEKQHAEDRLMTPAEQITLPMQLREREIEQAIAIAKTIGFPTSHLTEKLQDLEINRRIIMWLDTFSDDDEKAEALERITREGLPPEVFKDDSNTVVEGPSTLQ